MKKYLHFSSQPSLLFFAKSTSLKRSSSKIIPWMTDILCELGCFPFNKLHSRNFKIIYDYIFPIKLFKKCVPNDTIVSVVSFCKYWYFPCSWSPLLFLFGLLAWYELIEALSCFSKSLSCVRVCISFHDPV